MPHMTFSALGGLLSTIIIAFATYYVAAQPPGWQQTANQPVIVKPAPIPLVQTAAREELDVRLRAR
ncbi:MAG: hypothetical protein AB7E81_00290 [Hyphomicrobiaceae bacterium]